MSAFVLNVIGDDAAPDIFAPLALGKPTILSPGRAFDLPVAAQDSAPLLAAARGFAEGLKLDINVVATAHRRKKLLIADMDSTIINVECLDELADMAGLKPQIAAITERAMRGELEFEAALRERVGMLKGLKLDALERTYAERVRLNPGAKSLLATMRANGAHTMLVSGGFGFFTARVARSGGLPCRARQHLAGRRRGADRRSRHADSGPRGQAAGAGRRRGESEARLCRNPGGRRRRQRSGDDPARRPGRRLSRQAGGGRPPQAPRSTTTT